MLDRLKNASSALPGYRHVVRSMPDPLPLLSRADLEILLSALDPVLDGFGEGGSCLDDASAYLARLGGTSEGTERTDLSRLIHWIERWREVGGNRQTLRLMVSTLLSLNHPQESFGG
jgi:hypothetical protein